MSGWRRARGRLISDGAQSCRPSIDHHVQLCCRVPSRLVGRVVVSWKHRVRGLFRWRMTKSMPPPALGCRASSAIVTVTRQDGQAGTRRENREVEEQLGSPHDDAAVRRPQGSPRSWLRAGLALGRCLLALAATCADQLLIESGFPSTARGLEPGPFTSLWRSERAHDRAVVSTAAPAIGWLGGGRPSLALSPPGSPSPTPVCVCPPGRGVLPPATWPGSPTARLLYLSRRVGPPVTHRRSPRPLGAGGPGSSGRGGVAFLTAREPMPGTRVPEIVTPWGPALASGPLTAAFPVGALLPCSCCRRGRSAALQVPCARGRSGSSSGGWPWGRLAALALVVSSLTALVVEHSTCRVRPPSASASWCCR